MAQTGNIAEMLQSLLSGLNSETSESAGEPQNNANEAFSTDNTQENAGNGSFGDFSSFFENIDIDMILKIGEIFARFNQPDKNADLLRALKPHMREENREKIDTAIKIMKITALWPFIKESGFMDKIF
ncbi:MAG: hypothetical protein FWG44_00415 [Oscillospiraceae bacterium]|nr:hypothetical protein [Oscillospiraceae bacterium]